LFADLLRWIDGDEESFVHGCVGGSLLGLHCGEGFYRGHGPLLQPSGTLPP
jgi:hypothetical protein